MNIVNIASQSALVTLPYLTYARLYRVMCPPYNSPTIIRTVSHFFLVSSDYILTTTVSLNSMNLLYEEQAHAYFRISKTAR